MSSDTINIKNPAEDPRFMNAFMIVAESLKTTAKTRSIAADTGDCRVMSKDLLLALKRSGYILKKEKAA
jgi:hypothetical protein